MLMFAEIGGACIGARIAVPWSSTITAEPRTLHAYHYFGPTAPSGMEANWLPTNPDRRFFLLFRFYGQETGVLDGSFVLNDIEKLN
jgi:hypothetical protein